MAIVQLPDELERVIARQVAEGRAASASAFLEETVMRLVEEARSEEEDVAAAVQAGIADIETGRYTAVTSAEDERALRERMMARLRAHLAAEE
jgi:Arc/MetJ-type ribon-helix-helix transcriptional regulator